MAGFSQVEVNAIRELVSGHTTAHAKLSEYASQVSDNEIKKMFEQAAQGAQKSAQNLISIL